MRFKQKAQHACHYLLLTNICTAHGLADPNNHQNHQQQLHLAATYLRQLLCISRTCSCSRAPSMLLPAALSAMRAAFSLKPIAVSRHTREAFTLCGPCSSSSICSSQHLNSEFREQHSLTEVACAACACACTEPQPLEAPAACHAMQAACVCCRACSFGIRVPCCSGSFTYSTRQKHRHRDRGT